MDAACFVDRVDPSSDGGEVLREARRPILGWGGDAIKRGFEAYGTALRAGKGKGKAAGTPKVRAPLARFASALRSYVLNVTTYGGLGGEGSTEQALADARFAPLGRWQSPGGGRRARGDASGGANGGVDADGGAGDDGAGDAGGHGGVTGDRGDGAGDA